MNRKEIIKDLANKTLKDKWKKIKSFETYDTGPCAFCYRAREDSGKASAHICSVCFLPPYFCNAVKAYNSLVSSIRMDIHNHNLDGFKRGIKLLKKGLKELSRKGKVSNNTVYKIKIYLGDY